MTQRLEKAAPFGVLVAEDSEFDRTLLRDAFEELDFDIELTFVCDGEELFDYLRRGTEADGATAPLPALILMDLNMPRMKGMDALRALRADALLRALPVIILSTSSNPQQITQAYSSGVNAYMTKPQRFNDLLDMLQKFGDFWLRATKLPNPAALA